MGNFKDLPTDILLDIITRLPIESILDCKLVCRPWRNLVSHQPSFCQLHLTHLNRSTDSGKLSFIFLGANRDLHYFQYNEIHDETPPMHRIRRFNLTPPFRNFYHKVIGSFNGLVCLYGWQDSAYCICNPVTKQYVMVPTVRRYCADQYVYMASGFGYLPSTNQYKVVDLSESRGDPKFTQVAVYTLGSGKEWRNVERLEFTFPISFAQNGVYANEALHWIDNRGERVFVFDLTEERFGENISPPSVPQDGTYHAYTIGELDGLLYCAINYYLVGRTCSDIWLLKEKNDNLDMKQQMEHEPFGWSKLKEFQLPQKEPIAFTKSGAVLCLGYWHLSVYDTVASTLKNIVDFTAFRQIFPHKNTLVALKELGEEDIKLMEFTEIEETKSHVLQQSS